jgi:hypothetical protein
MSAAIELKINLNAYKRSLERRIREVHTHNPARGTSDLVEKVQAIKVLLKGLS